MSRADELAAERKRGRCYGDSLWNVGRRQSMKMRRRRAHARASLGLSLRRAYLPVPLKGRRCIPRRSAECSLLLYIGRTSSLTRFTSDCPSTERCVQVVSLARCCARAFVRCGRSLSLFCSEHCRLRRLPDDEPPYIVVVDAGTTGKAVFAPWTSREHDKRGVTYF